MAVIATLIHVVEICVAWWASSCMLDCQNERPEVETPIKAMEKALDTNGMCAQGFKEEE